MTIDEAGDEIVKAVRVTRADVVAAKVFIADAGSGRIDIRSRMQAWSQTVAPGTPNELRLDGADVPHEIATIARSMAAQLSLAVAAWELLHAGVAFQAGTHAGWEPSVTWRTSHGGGGLNFRGRLTMVYPEAILRPEWNDRPSELWDADLYLRQLPTGALHPGVETALRLSLDCFRRELYVPCLAMLGAASEGAWVEAGIAVAKSRPSEPQASRLLTVLGDTQKSIRTKITQTCGLYSRTDLFNDVYLKSGVAHSRLTEIAGWSDVIREARNVLHWKVEPTVPNTYEKVAVLLMGASASLAALHAIRDAVAA